MSHIEASSFEIRDDEPALDMPEGVPFVRRHPSTPPTERVSSEMASTVSHIMTMV